MPVLSPILPTAAATARGHAAANHGTRVRGALLQDAVFAVTPTAPHIGVLTVQIAMPKGQPYEARLVIGTLPCAHVAARAKAALLRQGQMVEVHAQGGVRQRLGRGRAISQLQAVTDILPLQTHHHTDHQDDPA